MKIKSLLSIILFSLALTSCNTGMPDTEVDTLAKTISVYSLLDYDDSKKEDSNYKVMEFEARVKKGEDYMPYISLESYDKFVKSELNEDYVTDIENTLYLTKYHILKQGADSYNFISNIDVTKDCFLYAGDLSGCLKSHGNKGVKSSLLLDANVTGKGAKRGSSVIYYYYFKDIGFDKFRYHNQLYLPLSLFNLAYSSLFGFNLMYNYDSIYAVNDYSVFTDASLKDKDNNAYTPFSKMKAIVDETIKVMPSYLINERMASIYFLFENLYGLKYTRNIESMKQYIDEKGLNTRLTSTDVVTRGRALADLIASLDDGHTSISRSKSPYDENNYSYYGEKLTKMIQEATTLKGYRDALYASEGKSVGDVIYSSDESTALISFDGFVFTYDVYEEDGETRKDLSKSDTYYSLVKAFHEIEAREDDKVKDIVLDIAINGGGTVGVLMEILALTSKTNAPTISLADQNIVYKYTTEVDSNLDGVYSYKDCYGDDYNIHFLTSNYSYSCGNALPYIALDNKDADVIGRRSGGGECTVGYHVLPSGECIYHSSLMHIGKYDEVNNIFTGDEGGAEVSKEIALDKFYDLDYLDSLFN